MNGMGATLRRELAAYFVSPIAYVVMASFLLLNGCAFVFFVLGGPQGTSLNNAVVYLFTNIFLYLLLLPGACLILTMRLLSEERRSGSLEVLMTTPITEVQVVVGKYLAALLFYAFLWLPILIYGLVLGWHGSLAWVDWGALAAGYVGLLGIGAFFLAVGLFASSLSRSQLVAAVLALVAYGFFLLFPTLMAEMVTGARRGALEHLNLYNHLQEFSRGIVDTRRLVFYASGAVFFLFLSSRALAANKWR